MNVLLNADAGHIPLADESVHCVVTSPPYWGLRKYTGLGDNQLGMEPTPERYVSNMVAIFREVRRVLRDDGIVFLNMGDSYFSSVSRNVDAYDTSDKAPEGYQDRDCLCQNLCDACRRAYRIGKSHNDNQRAPMLASLSPKSTPGHMESVPDHLPTSDLIHQDARNPNATQDVERFQDRDAVHPPAFQESTPDVSSRRSQEDFRQSDNPSACLLCGRSLVDDAQVSAHRLADSLGQLPRNQGNVSGDALQERHNQNRDTACDYCVSSSRDILPQSTISLKPKDLCGVPWRVAFALQADGWWLRSDIIWAKPNPMPEGVRDRPAKGHEYLFLLSKSARYYYDVDAVKERGVNGSLRNQRTVWKIVTAPYRGAHFATYPPKLIEPCIKAGCPADGIVLDSFVGSGTTLLVARQLGRRAVGLDLSLPYLRDQARKRLQLTTL